MKNSRNLSERPYIVLVGVVAVTLTAFGAAVLLIDSGTRVTETGAMSATTLATDGSLFADRSTTEGLGQSDWMVTGQHILVRSPQPLSFSRDVRIVSSGRSDALEELVISGDGIEWQIPPGMYGAIVHSPAHAVELQRFLTAGRQAAHDQ